MAFPEKITNREYKVAGWFLFILGGLLFTIALQLGEPDAEPKSIPMIVLSGLMLFSGFLCLVTKPTAFTLILGGVSFLGLGIVLILEKEGLNGIMRSVLTVVSCAIIGSALGYVIKIFKKRSKGATQDPSSSESPPDDQPEPHDEH